MRLHIHDQEERHGRYDEDNGILLDYWRSSSTIKLPVKDVAGLHAGLAQLVKERKNFDRVLCMTHGSPGRIWFGKESVSSEALESTAFTGKGYEQLFPGPTKVYFAGCNVAGDADCNGACNPATRDAGWKFLENAGKLFLHGGGYTMGWTSLGYGWNDAFSRFLMGGHTLHFSGDVRHVTFGRGGKVLERLSYGGFFDKIEVLLKLKKVGPGD